MKDKDYPVIPVLVGWNDDYYFGDLREHPPKSTIVGIADVKLLRKQLSAAKLQKIHDTGIVDDEDVVARFANWTFFCPDGLVFVKRPG